MPINKKNKFFSTPHHITPSPLVNPLVRMTEHRFALLLEGPDALLGIRIGEVIDHDRAARAVCRVQTQLQLPAVEPLTQGDHRPRFARYGGADSLQLCLHLTGLHQLTGGRRRSK
jgi:hypothetical protein